MAGGSATAVYTAIVVNGLITVAKGVGFMFTGSGAMLAETVHSAADVGNQTLLAVGMKSAERPATVDHPDGFGRDAFVWALMSAVGIFFLGCGLSIMHGVEALLAHEAHAFEGGDIAIGVLVLSTVLETYSLGVAVRGAMAHARSRGLGFWKHVRTSEDPFEVAVLLEDAAAVSGVLIALASIALAESTGSANWDAYGTLAIGVLLGWVALALIVRTRHLLVGARAGVGTCLAVDAALEGHPAVMRVVSRAVLVEGPSTYSARAKVVFDGGYIATRAGVDPVLGARVVAALGDEIDGIEDRVRSAVPTMGRIRIEPASPDDKG